VNFSLLIRRRRTFLPYVAGKEGKGETFHMVQAVQGTKGAGTAAPTSKIPFFAPWENYNAEDKGG